MSGDAVSMRAGFGPAWIFVAAVAWQGSNVCTAKSFNDAVNDCDERVLTSIVAKHGVPNPNCVTSRPNSVNEFVARLVMIAPWLSKLGQGPPLILPPLLKPHSPTAPPTSWQPSPLSVSTRT